MPTFSITFTLWLFQITILFDTIFPIAFEFQIKYTQNLVSMYSNLKLNNIINAYFKQLQWIFKWNKKKISLFTFQNELRDNFVVVKANLF